MKVGQLLQKKRDFFFQNFLPLAVFLWFGKFLPLFKQRVQRNRVGLFLLFFQISAEPALDYKACKGQKCAPFRLVTSDSFCKGRQSNAEFIVIFNRYIPPCYSADSFN